MMNKIFLGLIVVLILAGGFFYLRSVEERPVPQPEPRTYDEHVRIAEGMSSVELEERIRTEYAAVTKSGTTDLSKLSAYMQVYLGGEAADPEIEAMNDSLVMKFGPCWGLSEEQCRE